MQQMRYLQQKNESLERSLQESRKQQQEKSYDGEPEPSPRGTPCPSDTPHSSVKKSSRRHSCLDMSNSGRRLSTSSKAGTTQKQKRLSIAHEALSTMREDRSER